MTELSNETIKKLIREEITILFKDFQARINKTVLDTIDELIKKVNVIDDINQKNTVKLDQLNTMVNTDKAFVDRIEDLLSFQKRTIDQLNSHELRISNLQKTLTNACYKYDKIFLDNLAIPGTIGEFCRFKNVKEYIEVTYCNLV
jgi:hypothetical protein